MTNMVRKGWHLCRKTYFAEKKILVCKYQRHAESQGKMVNVISYLTPFKNTFGDLVNATNSPTVTVPALVVFDTEEQAMSKILIFVKL